MRVNAGQLAAAEGFENQVQNWDEDDTSLTHTGSGLNLPTGPG